MSTQTYRTDLGLDQDDCVVFELTNIGLTIMVGHTAGIDGALIVQIDTWQGEQSFEPDGSDGPGLRVFLNDSDLYLGVPYVSGYVEGILVGQTYGESDPVEPPPAGHSWVPIQRDDNNPRYEDDEAAAAAYAALIGSPVDPVWGEPTDRPREGSCDVFVAVKNKLTDPEEGPR